MEVDFTLARITDLPEVSKFTDFWLSGRGLRVHAPGAVNDCFISPSQHKRYIEKYETRLAHSNGELIGWAVVQNNGSLIHFLIAGPYRGLGIGSQFLKFIDPQQIHSKLDQSSGDPGPFYEKQGYRKIDTVKSHSRLDIDKIRPDRKKNIDIYEKIA
ncbi:GNAT family N-acetyltransferase [Candidatus Pacearchaeota archaeon]|nr:GNAT family N-acetyltransferase [Candidatus Pacearchaeota archaeon]